MVKPKQNAVENSFITVQGGSLVTWSYQSRAVDQVQVEITTEGRPLDADIELWNGPENIPNKIRVYVEDGQQRPFTAPRSTSSRPSEREPSP